MSVPTLENIDHTRTIRSIDNVIKGSSLIHPPTIRKMLQECESKDNKTEQFLATGHRTCEWHPPTAPSPNPADCLLILRSAMIHHPPGSYTADKQQPTTWQPPLQTLNRLLMFTRRIFLYCTLPLCTLKLIVSWHFCLVSLITMFNWCLMLLGGLTEQQYHRAYDYYLSIDFVSLYAQQTFETVE